MTLYNDDKVKNNHKDALITGKLQSSHDEEVNVVNSEEFNVLQDVDLRIERESRNSFASSFSALNPHNSSKLTTFLLLNAMIGSGILNQPYVFKESGLLGGIIGFVLASGCIWLGLLLLTAAGVKEDIFEYSGLAKRAFKNHGENIVDLSIIVLTFGSQLGYVLVVGTTLSELLQSWGCDNVVCKDFFTTIVSVGVFVTPVSIVAVLMLVLIAGPIKHDLDHTSSNYKVISIPGMLASTGSIVFSLSCASANFQAYITTETKAQNMKSWSYITGTAVGVGSIMCTVMGIAGYLSFGSSTEGMILDNFQQSGYDFFKVMVVTHLIMYIPVNFVIMRYSLVKITTGKRSELLDTTTHSILTIALLVVVTVIVLLLLGLGFASGAAFSLILNITGGIGGSLSNLILPAAIYLKVMPKYSDYHYHAWALLVVGCFVMVAVLAVTIMSFTN